MSSKPTPGPWVAKWDGTGPGKPHWCVVANASEPYPGAADIARTYGIDPYHTEEANARLMAAAPELLEMLRYFANFACEPIHSCDDDPSKSCANCKAAAVIAKAEGGAAS